MQDEAKTKEELIIELHELRQHVAELEKAQEASTDPAELRRPAEEWPKAGQTETDQRETDDTERLSHELAVHRIELEMQNEELRNALVQIEESRTRYSDLYDFAPVGYLTLDENGLVLEANLTVARQLGVERSRIVGSPLSAYIVIADRNAFRSHLVSVLKDKTHQACEVGFMKGGCGDFHALLDTILMEDAGGNGRLRISVTDITERKRNEEALSESYRNFQQTTQRVEQARNMLQLIIESIPVRVFWKDVNLRYMGCNTLFARDAGLNQPEQLLGLDDFTMGWKDQAEIYQADDRTVMESGISKTNIIEPQTTPTGDKIWLNTSKAPLRMPNGEIFGILGIYEDITERKQMEEELRGSEECYRSFFSSCLDAVLLTAPDGRIFAVNEAACRMFGLTEQELIQAGRSDVVDASDPRLVTALETRRCTGKFYGELTYLRKDGTKFFGETSSAVFTDLHGEPRTSMIIRDITDRKRAESSLRESEEQFRVLVESAPDAIFIQLEGRFAYVNEAARRLYGAESEKELLDHDIMDRIHPDYRANFLERIRLIDEERKPASLIEQKHLKLDGATIDVEINSTPIRYQKSDGGLVFVRDITERKRAEEALRQSEEQFKSMFEIASIGMAQADPKTGRWQRVNQKMCEITGYPSGEMLAMRIPELTHPEDRERDWEAFQNVINGKSKNYRLEKRYIRKDGTIVWVN
ncbi:MAG: PAS domain S-box protein, partial [Syntrophobacteraceae bacterium]